MSAYQVDTDLIDLIVSATTQRDYTHDNIEPIHIFYRETDEGRATWQWSREYHDQRMAETRAKILENMNQ